MNFWENIKKDVQKGLKEGVEAVKEGSAVVKKKAEDLSSEAQKQYKIFNLKSKVHKLISELGGRVYALHTTTKDPFKHKGVQSIISKINKIEMQLAKLETGKKTPVKRTASGIKKRKKRQV